MAATPVVGHRLGWRVGDNKGVVVLKLRAGHEVTIEVDSAAELTALAAILNESPVAYDPQTGTLSTGWENVGGTG